MTRYEMKKVFARTSNKVALILLAAVVCFTFWLSVTDHAYFVNESGGHEYGYRAVRKLRDAQKEWAGVLDENKIKAVIEENARINATPQAGSENVAERETAYGWKQGIDGIRNLLNYSYADGFRSSDYYRADRLKSEDAGSFYDNRTILLKDWLSSDEDDAKEKFSEREKTYLIRQYEMLDTPFCYDYMLGWKQLSEYLQTVIMFAMLILGYLVAGIFSNEFHYRADAIFFASVYGRNKAVAAKIKAGFCIVSLIYWTAVLLYSLAVLLFLGVDGAACPVQADWTGWKCFYNISNRQKYLLTVVGGYIGCLFISFLVMYVSAKTRSAVIAVIFPFVLLFVPTFIGEISSPLMDKILGLLPDRLLQVNRALMYFDLYEIFGKVAGAIPIIFVMYGTLTVVLLPVIYGEYCKKIV